MKKIGILMLMGVALGVCSAHAQSGNPNALENRAVAAAQSCAQPYTGPHTLVYAELSGQGRCFNGGTLNTYSVKVAYTAPPPLLPYVLLPGPVTVATVTFDCDNRVSSVSCE